MGRNAQRRRRAKMLTGTAGLDGKPKRFNRRSRRYLAKKRRDGA